MHASLEHSSMAGALPSDDFGDDLIAEIKHLRAFAVSLSGSASASDDLLQETLLRAWSKSTQFRDGTNLRALVANDLAEPFVPVFAFRKRAREVQTVDGVCARHFTVSGIRKAILEVLPLGRTFA